MGDPSERFDDTPSASWLNTGEYRLGFVSMAGLGNSKESVMKEEKQAPAGLKQHTTCWSHRLQIQHSMTYTYHKIASTESTGKVLWWC